MTRAGKSASGEQRYRCRASDCPTQTFMLNYRYKGYEPGIKEQIVDMALNGSGIRDTARVLDISKKRRCWNRWGISHYYTDDRGAYERHLEAEKHEVGKRNTQKIERKNLNGRTWIKRLARKTICFSKTETMHDTVIGLLINRVEFGLDIHAM